jgi:predicted unusual protein kinase regulating ubiquinone biosynthesis (AarF/ABC1/UbiB family)
MLRARYNRIIFFFARILLSFIYWELFLPRIGLKGRVQRTRSRRLKQSAAQFRSLAVEMGGLLIKLGQFFSARVDVLPEEITSELAGLQDEVPPEKFEDLRRLAVAEFGMPVEENFYEFEEEPLAAASLGQVHRAKAESERFTQGHKLKLVMLKREIHHLPASPGFGMDFCGCKNPTAEYRKHYPN